MNKPAEPVILRVTMSRQMLSMLGILQTTGLYGGNVETAAERALAERLKELFGPTLMRRLLNQRKG